MAVPNRRRDRRQENLDILLGFLGFFGLVLVVVIIASELDGRNAAPWSVTLLGVVLALWALRRAKRRPNNS
ncbi:hypothetical protein ACX80W_16060 [Arthrobacter sp. TMN-37]